MQVERQALTVRCNLLPTRDQALDGTDRPLQLPSAVPLFCMHAVSGERPTGG